MKTTLVLFFLTLGLIAHGIGNDGGNAGGSPNTSGGIFKSDEIQLSLCANQNFSGTFLDNLVVQPTSPATFGEEGMPSWMTLTSDGTLSGDPQTSDIGNDTFTVSVIIGTHTGITNVYVTVKACP